MDIIPQPKIKSMARSKHTVTAARNRCTIALAAMPIQRRQSLKPSITD
ncbi:hypothetical protein QWZ13_05770 [Reinekea marina]|nr:hypothetical protein [Reinekea marina]MDN3648413.1 hypothetical protein [Reinekea marina]